jgi:uncharacterized protein YcbX
MSVLGHIDSVWRYPVKSMQGEALAEAFVGFAGVYGDRLYAVHNPAALRGFPYLTARDQGSMLRYRPRFRDPEVAAKPPNLAAAESLGPGLTPLYPAPEALAVEVVTPAGQALAIDDPRLLAELADGAAANLSIIRSDRALTDCRPVSLISLQTVRQLGDEVGLALDRRRFRANLYADLADGDGFAEDALIGRRLRIGAQLVLALLERDPRCKMITLDPDTGEANPEILRRVARGHNGNAGVYGAVLAEGLVRPGDEIVLLE